MIHSHGLVREERRRASHGGEAQKRRTAVRIFMGSAIGAALGLATANPLLTAGGILLLPILFVLLWRPNEPPVLLFAVFFQWLQVFAPVVVSDFRGEVIGSAELLPELNRAAWLGLTTVCVLAIGIRQGRGGGGIIATEQLQDASAGLSVRRLFTAYVLAFFAAILALRVGQAVPGLRQILLPVSLLRWAVVFLVLWCAISERRFRPLAGACLVLEVAIGFGGFFSSFKTIIFLAIVVMAGHPISRMRVLRPSVIAGVIIGILLMSYWQAVKEDYRAFLNQGTTSQAVLVTPEERAEYLLERSQELTVQDLVDGFGRGIERLGYLEFFARTMQMVPHYIPYQDGRLWGEAIGHILMPRLFYPSKEAISDSDRTNEFSGLRVAGEEEGTSISIGYAAESYIDFGPLFMFVPIYLLGAMWGLAFRWLLHVASNPLLGVAIATNFILTSALLFESSNIKLLGGAVSSLIFLTLLLRFGRTRIWDLLSDARFGQWDPARELP